jgi:hypothetical protein
MDEATDSVTDQPPRRWVWQIGLRTLFLLITVVAVWTVYFSNRSAIRTYEERIAAMKPLARELTIDDEFKIAVIKKEPYWYDENRWEVYLPPGTYRLCLATREIDESGFAPIAASIPLSPGRHTLSLEQVKTDDGWRVVVECDGQQVLATDEPKAWYPAVGSVGGGEFDSLTEREPSEPLVLFRRRFTLPAAGGRNTTPTGPADGVMLWIE